MALRHPYSPVKKNRMIQLKLFLISIQESDIISKPVSLFGPNDGTDNMTPLNTHILQSNTLRQPKLMSLVFCCLLYCDFFDPIPLSSVLYKLQFSTFVQPATMAIFTQLPDYLATAEKNSLNLNFFIVSSSFQFHCTPKLMFSIQRQIKYQSD